MKKKRLTINQYIFWCVFIKHFTNVHVSSNMSYPILWLIFLCHCIYVIPFFLAWCSWFQKRKTSCKLQHVSAQNYRRDTFNSWVHVWSVSSYLQGAEGKYSHTRLPTVSKASDFACCKRKSCIRNLSYVISTHFSVPVVLHHSFTFLAISNSKPSRIDLFFSQLWSVMSNYFFVYPECPK